MKIFLNFSMVLLLLCSCSKFEEGPLISTRSKTERLVNTWAYTLVLRNGVNVTFGQVDGENNFAASSIGFNDEGRFSDIIFNGNNFIQKDGDWMFDEADFAELNLNYDDGDIRTFTIVRLKEKELKLEEQIGDNLYEYHFLPNR